LKDKSVESKDTYLTKLISANFLKTYGQNGT